MGQTCPSLACPCLSMHPASKGNLLRSPHPRCQVGKVGVLFKGFVLQTELCLPLKTHSLPSSPRATVLLEGFTAPSILCWISGSSLSPETFLSAPS